MPTTKKTRKKKKSELVMSPEEIKQPLELTLPNNVVPVVKGVITMDDKGNIEDVTVQTIQNTILGNVPPFAFTRNEYGLLEHVIYTFNEKGYVDWRKMISKEHFFPNRKHFQGLTEEEFSQLDINTLTDEQLLIKLDGFREVAMLRGYTDIDYHTIYASESTIAVSSSIEWIGNYETSNRKTKFTALADAKLENTYGFTRDFLTTIAENRAFVRAVREFLRIPIYGDVELDITTLKTGISDSDPRTLLEKKLKEKEISFEDLKTALVDSNPPEQIEAWGVKKWTYIEDVPATAVFEILSKM